MGRPYDDDTDTDTDVEMMPLSSIKGRYEQGRGMPRSGGGGGRRGGGARSMLRTRSSMDGNDALLASERQTNAWLAVAVVGLVASVVFILYDRLDLGGTTAPEPEAPAANVRGKNGGILGTSGVHGNPGEDDDWYDDKFQREIPNAKRKPHSTVDRTPPARISGPAAVTGTTGKEGKLGSKELIEMVQGDKIGNVDYSEESGENEDDDMFQSVDGREKDGESQDETHDKEWNELNAVDVAAAAAFAVEAEKPKHAETQHLKDSSSSSKQHKEQSDTETILIRLEPYATWNIPYRKESDLPVFWHVPMSAGTTFEDILSHCYGLVEANEIGVFGGHDEDEELMIVETEDGGRYINADTTTQEGIARAKDLGLAASGLADVIVTPFLHASASLFRGTRVRGKCHALLRHPIHRAVAMFYFLASNASRDSPFYDMTIEEYAAGPYCEENWMVRILTGEMTGVLQWRHLDLAKEILGRKCLVGLVNQFDKSLTRFKRYFGWNELVVEEDKNPCEERLITHGDNVHLHPKYKEGSAVWELLKKKNGHDLMLYEYAEELFEKQAMYSDMGAL